LSKTGGGRKYAISGKSCGLWAADGGRYAGVMSKSADPTIRNLYPDLSEKEFSEAERNLDLYLALVLRILERVESETNPQACQLTRRAGTLGSSSPQPSA